jgi:hypothetical protein
LTMASAGVDRSSGMREIGVNTACAKVPLDSHDGIGEASEVGSSRPARARRSSRSSRRSARVLPVG